MKNWEDIIKDRLEGYESPLPEGSLAGFRALRASGKPVKKGHTLVWVMATAVAAGIAAFIILQQPSSQEESIHVINKRPEAVAQVDKPVSVQEPVKEAETEVVTETVTKSVKKEVTPRKETVSVEVTEPVAVVETIEETETTKEVEATEVAESAEVVESTDVVESGVSTWTPVLTETHRPVKMNIRPVVGGVLGGGAAAVLTAVLLPGSNLAYSDEKAYDFDPGSGMLHEGEKMKVLSESHSMPLKLGLSARFPVSNRLHFTGGVEYSLYSSKFTVGTSYSSTIISQHCNYLGIPMRLDWSLASGRWLDLYIGAGIEPEFCTYAKYDGKNIKKDGAALSLIGAGGLQFNFTRHMGIYAEPQFGWYVLSSKKVLDNFRNENPLIFTISTGLRYTF